MKTWLTSSILALVIAVPSVLRTSADTFVVDELGNGDFTTIPAAISSATDGDTIEVRPGTYPGFTVNKSLTIRGAGPDRVMIEGLINASADLRLSGVFVSNPTGNGILTRAHRIDLRIENCVVAYCAIYGINASYGQNHFVGRIEVRNCTFVHNAWGVVAAEAQVNEGTVVIQGCIFTDHLTGALSLHLGTENHTYNLFFNNSGQDFEGTTRDEGELVLTDPLFMDSERGNYVLRSDSPAINAGPPAANRLDPDGTRNDMGAFGGPGAAGFWPYVVHGPTITDLTVTPTSVPKGGTIRIQATARVNNE